MTTIIEQLRKHDGLDGYWRYYGDEPSVEIAEDIMDILYSAKATQVHSKLEEGGRWSNYETHVWKVEENGDVAYFEEAREVPASESQDGMDLSYQFYEVYPHIVTTTVYKSYPQKPEAV